MTSHSQGRRWGVAVVLMGLVGAGVAGAHCQVPCGIYNDELRIALMEEHLTTIAKAMKLIPAMTEAGNMNQVVRWVQTKEKHAEELSHLITFYFMAQRVKPVAETDKAALDRYVKQVTLLHQLLVATMKTKQGIDTKTVDAAHKLLDAFEIAYFGKHVVFEHEHDH